MPIKNNKSARFAFKNIDSLKDIALNCNIVLETLGYPIHELNDYKNFVGDGAKILVKNALPKDATSDQLDNAVELFKEVYEKNLHHNTYLYDGIDDLLQTLVLKNYQLAILSNKPHKFTNLYAQKLISNIPFVDIIGQKDEVPKKPDPIAALQIASKFQLDSSDILFVGDTPTDMKTAKNSNMIAVGVAWGFRSVDELLENGADYIIKTPEELLDVLDHLSNNLPK